MTKIPSDSGIRLKRFRWRRLVAILIVHCCSAVRDGHGPRGRTRGTRLIYRYGNGWNSSNKRHTENIIIYRTVYLLFSISSSSIGRGVNAMHSLLRFCCSILRRFVPLVFCQHYFTLSRHVIVEWANRLWCEIDARQNKRRREGERGREWGKFAIQLWIDSVTVIYELRQQSIFYNIFTSEVGAFVMCPFRSQ